MKILFATMQFGRGYAQGTERYLGLLRDGLHARGHRTHVIAGDPERRGPPQALGEPVPGTDGLLACPTISWAAVEGSPASAYGPLLDSLQPDVVHVLNPGHIGLGLATAAAERGVPLVFTTMDYWWMCPKHTLMRHHTEVCAGARPASDCLPCITADRKDGWRHMLLLPQPLRAPVIAAVYASRWRRLGVSGDEISRFSRRQIHIDALLKQASAVIFPSLTAQRLLGDRISPKRGVRIPYGLEQHWFESRREPRAGRTPFAPSLRPEGASAPVIGFAGALAPHKGADVLIDALKRLDWRHTRVRIAGGGDDAFISHLKQQAGGLDVEWVGRVAPDHMPAFMATLDVLVVPSRWPENLPFVALEAFAVGTPVIASDVGGIAEIVEDADMRFAVGSAEGLAMCLRKLTHRESSPAIPRISTADDMVCDTERVYAGVVRR